MVRGGSQRRLLLLAAAIAAALIVIALVSRSGAPGSTGSAPPTTAVGPARTVPAAGTPAATGTSSSTSTTVPPPLFNQKTATVLLLGGGSRLTALNLDANSTRSYDLPAGIVANFGNFGQGPGQASQFLIGRDRLAVFQAGNQTMAIPADLSRPPVALGRSVSFIASVHPDRVWLLGLASGGPTVREVDLAGRTTSPLVALPTDWVPQAATDNGLVLSNGLTFEVWDPVRARVVRPGPQFAQVQAANDRMVVWTSTFGCQLLCAIHISDVVAGTDRAIYAQSGTVSAAAFSPDGRRLALGLNPNGDQLSDGGLLMVDLSSYSTSLRSISAAASSELLWAPSGQWLFFLNAGNGPTLIEAYRLDAASAQLVNLPSTVSGSAFAAF